MSEPTEITPPLETAIDAVKHALDENRKTFEARLKRTTENREALLRWIKQELVDEIDFGRIHWPAKPSRNAKPGTVTCDKGEACSVSWHWSKPAMRKPGAEKICALLGLRPTWPGLEALERAVSIDCRTPDSILLRCYLLDRHGQIVGEGIGGRDVRRDGNVNKAVKMAKKSGHIDATLVTAGLSELFTQDFGDPDDADPTTGDLMLSADVCTVGPLKGHAWDQIPDDYLEHIREIDDVPDDVKAIAKQELERRSDAGVTVDEMPTRAASSRDDWTMRDAAQAIMGAQTLEELETLLEEIPERYTHSQARTIERMRKALGDRHE